MPSAFWPPRLPRWWARARNGRWPVCSPRGEPMSLKGEFAGMNDFEVVAFLVVLPEETR